ncbi:MAG: SOS response-associated peptidase [Bacteroidota bacterium]
MCYTIALNKTRTEIEQRYGKKFNPKAHFRPSYYVTGFAFPSHPVITSVSEEIEMYDWGLIPFWFKEKDDLNKIRTSTLNARSESVDKKPSFRQAYKSNRCLIPASGFFEWHTKGKEKIPYFIHLKNNKIFSIAGIFDHWKDASGKKTTTFSVITTAANPLMEKIHNTKKRMPVILSEEQEPLWLDDEISAEQRKKLFEPFPEEKLDAHTISKLITKRGADKNVPELIEPYHYEEPGLF